MFGALLFSTAVLATPDDAGFSSLQPICATSDSILFLEHAGNNGGTYYARNVALSWVLIRASDAKRTTIPVVEIHDNRMPEDDGGVTWSGTVAGAKDSGSLASALSATPAPHCDWLDSVAVLPGAWELAGTRLAYANGSHRGELTFKRPERSEGWSAYEPIAVQLRAQYRLGAATLLRFEASGDLAGTPLFVPVRTAEVQKVQADVFNDIGLEALRAKKYDEAVAAFQRAAGLDQVRAHLRYNLACAYARKKDVKMALNFLEASKNQPGFKKKIARDKDLAPIRGSPEFKAFFEALPER